MIKTMLNRTCNKCIYHIKVNELKKNTLYCRKIKEYKTEPSIYNDTAYCINIMDDSILVSTSCLKDDEIKFIIDNKKNEEYLNALDARKYICGAMGKFFIPLNCDYDI